MTPRNPCCCNPCLTYTAGYGANHNAVNGAASIVPTGTASWTLDSGIVRYNGSGSHELSYAVPREDRASPLVLRAVAAGLNLSSAGGGIKMIVNGTVVTLMVDPATDKVTLTYGTTSLTVGDWLVDGSDLSLEVTATECGAAFRWGIGANYGNVESRRFSFGAAAATYAMNLVGSVAPNTVASPCCVEKMPDVFAATGVTVGGALPTASAGGNFTYDPVDVRWKGSLTISWAGEDGCLAFSETYSGMHLRCTGSSASGWVLGQAAGSPGASFGGDIAAEASSSCNTPLAIKFRKAYSLFCGGIPRGITVEITFAAATGGGGPNGTRFDDLRLSACGTIPTGCVRTTKIAEGCVSLGKCVEQVPTDYDLVVPVGVVAPGCYAPCASAFEGAFQLTHVSRIYHIHPQPDGECCYWQSTNGPQWNVPGADAKLNLVFCNVDGSCSNFSGLADRPARWAFGYSGSSGRWSLAATAGGSESASTVAAYELAEVYPPNVMVAKTLTRTVLAAGYSFPASLTVTPVL